MKSLSSEEIEKIVNSVDFPQSKEQKIPLRPPLKKGGKLHLPALQGEKLKPVESLTDKALSPLADIQLTVEAFYGKTRLSIKELAALCPGSLVPLDGVCDELITLYANGTKIARGELIAYDGRYAIKVISLEN
jgi:flagellar motor switch/type III secretory pathway protein FliN